MSAHDEWLEQATAYALGALDGPAAAVFSAHLTGCELCQREVRSLSEVAALLALAPREVSPPPALRGRILAEVRAAAGGGGGARATFVVAPPSEAPPAHENAQMSAGGNASNAPPARDGRHLRLEPGSYAEPVAAPQPAPAPAAPRGRSSAPRTVLPWILAAASIALAATLGTALVELRDERNLYVRATARLQAELTDRGRQIAQRDSTIASILGPEVQIVNMQATGRAPSGRLFWNRRANRVVLAAYSIPRAPAGRTYQLWGLPGGNADPVSLGTFNTDAAGEAHVTLEIPAGVRIAASAITEEPAGGSSRPTTAPFLISNWPTD